MSTRSTARACSATLVMLAAIALTSACGSEPSAPSAAPPTSAVPQPTIRPYCQAAVPESWQRAIDASEVDVGGISTVPGAVGPAGEVAAVRDNGDTRDLLLIGADRSVEEIYQVPMPDRNDVGFVGMDARWIVVGVDRIPRGSNGVLPSLIRIDVIDRQGGAARTVVERSDDDYSRGGPSIDSVALFGDKVYWITHDSFAGSVGSMQSYDLASGAVADVESGSMGDVRATAAGLARVVDDGSVTPEDPLWKRIEVKLPAAIPAAVTAALGTGLDKLSLATDGTAYAWLTGLEQGTTGAAWWSPESGLMSITGDIVGPSDWLPPVHVVGPYVVIDRGRQDTDSVTTVVDTRSGAVIYLDKRVADATAGTIALHLGQRPNKGVTMPGVLRIDGLDPLTCS